MSFFSAFYGYLTFRKLIKKKNNKKIVFFSESKNYRNYLINLIKILDKDSNLSIFYITSDINDFDQISNRIKPIYIGNGFCRILLFSLINCDILIMTLTDLGNHEIKKSRFCKNYVYIFHSLVSTHKCYTHKAFKNYDVILCNGEYQLKELRYCENFFNFNRKKIFNTGYLYLENLVENKSKNLQQNKILFAPSWNKSLKNLFDDYADKIIGSLLEKEYKTILRTHPETINRSKMNLKKIKKKFSNNNNFQLNTDLQNLRPYNESCMLITDNGGIALEYIITQKKPVIYIDYVEKIHNEFFDKLGLHTIEDKFKKEIGTIIRIDQLEKIEFYIQQAKINFSEKINKIDELIAQHGLITKNQSNNSKDAILKILN
tara:strand:+ start:5729 stop:6850 length:1122 start_codon:yes stop_codon:yes gene_type:complete